MNKNLYSISQQSNALLAMATLSPHDALFDQLVGNLVARAEEDGKVCGFF
jgi:hypothetical protein